MTPSTRPNRLFRGAAPAVVLVSFLLVGGCSQDEGEPCQTDRDCADGLECQGAVNNERGKCVSPQNESSSPDASNDEPPPPAETDAGTDAGNGVVVDSGTDAAPRVDAAGDDAGTDDSDGG